LNSLWIAEAREYSELHCCQIALDKTILPPRSNIFALLHFTIKTTTLLLLAWWALELVWLFWRQVVIFGTKFLELTQIQRFCGSYISNNVCSPTFSGQKVRRRPGPKSRSHSRAHWCILLFGFFIMFWQSGWSEGCSFAMEGAGTSWTPFENLHHEHDVKEHGMQPQRCYGTQFGSKTPQHSQVVKRSLKRAQRRASQTGLAWYKGRCYTSSDFLRMGMPPIFESTPHARRSDIAQSHHLHRPKKRVTCFHWNGGGMAVEKFDALRVWLRDQNVGIAVITETRWTYENTWSDSSWHYLHTGDPNQRGAGVLIMIAASLCKQDDLRWNVAIPGRLIHVRVLRQTRNLDILGCYQHAQSREAQNAQHREMWWQALDRQLELLPSRNTLFLLGDCNCSLPITPGCCGTDVFRWKEALRTGPLHFDRARLSHILKRHGIVALNTWNAALGPTFISDTSASRIDYICTRSQFSDGTAKDVKYVWEAPFLPLKQIGHVPMLCQLALHWIPMTTVPASGPSALQRALGRQAKWSNAQEWTDFLDQSRHSLQHRLQLARNSVDAGLQQLHDTAKLFFCRAFPTAKKPPAQEPWQMGAPVVKSQWHHRACLHNIKGCAVHDIFQAWYHVTKFRTLKRRSKRQAHQLREHKFDSTLQEAAVSASRHDMHSLFKVINNNCPKNPRRKMQLRSDDGRLLTPIEEHAKLVSFVRETWAGTSLSLPSQAAPPGVPFDLTALTAALRLIPATKAVAPDCAPGMIWSGLAEDLAPPLFDLLHAWWNQSPPIIPTTWRTGWLVLIPKPAKPPSRPQNLRPLALQCPLGKAVIGLLTKLALQQALPELTRWPVWAYVPFRSVQDSLNKVALHCRLVQQLCASQRSTPHNRANATVRHTICGGIQIFLDIDRAFDSVDRCKLFTKLRDLGIEANIIQLLWGWHADTDYIVSHAGESTPVRVQKGLRQGCKAAPFLWNCLVTIFLRQLSSAVSMEWILNCLSIYADDFHIGCIFRNLDEMKVALHSIGQVLQMLTEFDLSVNPSKSVAIVSTSGTNWRKHRAKIVQQDHAGEKLQIPMPDGSLVFFPMQTQTKYLGCILGYGNFADKTTHHRVALAKVGFARLRRWLCSKSSHRQFRISRRFHLWQTCILPILTYGIFPIGLTPLGAQKILTVMQSMIRQLTGDHPSQTGHTHEFVHRQLSLPRPVELLLGALANLSESVSQRRLYSTSHDFACTLTWDHLLPMRQIILDAQAALDRRRAHSALSQEISVNEQLFQCACCTFQTNDTAAFRRHCTVAHGLRMYRTLALNPADFASQGLPTCKFCNRSFRTWHSFQTHVQRGCQAVLLGTTALHT